MARRKSRYGGRGFGIGLHLIGGIGPPIKRICEIGQWVAESGNLPIDYRDDCAVWSDKGVVKTIVTVNNPRRTLNRQIFQEKFLQCVGSGVIKLGGIDRRRPRLVPGP